MIWLFSRVKAGFHLRQSRNRNRKSAYDLVKLKNRSRKRSHKLDGIGVGKIRTFPFFNFATLLITPLLRSAYDLVKTKLSESEAEAEG